MKLNKWQNISLFNHFAGFNPDLYLKKNKTFGFYYYYYKLKKMHRHDSVITYFAPRENLKVFMGNIPFLEPYTILSTAM